MRGSYLLAGLVTLWAGSAHAQLFSQTQKAEPVFDTPESRIRTELKSPYMTDAELDGYMWQFRADSDPSDLKIRKDVVQSETGPFWSRFSVWADGTMPERSAEFGAGKISREAGAIPLPDDRWAASQLPEADYPGKEQTNQILAAVYRYFFSYRTHGFAADAKVYFLGLGPHVTDIPASLLAALQNDLELKKEGVTLRPLSKAMEITADALRDRDTGAYGPAFRVDDVGPVKDGEVEVTATFSEKNGFWLTRRLTVQQEKVGWEVVKDDDYPMD